jgi:hypothetical protein
MENKKVINRPSPKSHDRYVAEYLRHNPSANNPKDGLDVSAVTTTGGVPGYALLPEDKNRSRDKEVHIGKDFISSEELRKAMK